MGDLLGPPVGSAAVGSQLTSNYIRIDRQLHCATTSTRNSRVVDCIILDMYCLKRSVVLYIRRTSASTSSYGFHMDSYGTILLCGGIRLTQVSLLAEITVGSESHLFFLNVRRHGEMRPIRRGIMVDMAVCHENAAEHSGEQK